MTSGAARGKWLRDGIRCSRPLSNSRQPPLADRHGDGHQSGNEAAPSARLKVNLCVRALEKVAMRSIVHRTGLKR